MPIRLRKVRTRLGLLRAASTARPRPWTRPASGSAAASSRTCPEYPECPPGWRTGAPDFVIFGAQKSGTTWWFRLIEQHPGCRAAGQPAS